MGGGEVDASVDRNPRLGRAPSEDPPSQASFDGIGEGGWDGREALEAVIIMGLHLSR